MKKLYLPACIAAFWLCFFFLPASAYAIEVKPEDFGAVVNDGNDDSDAIQAAVNRVFQDGGGTVAFSGGKYNINKNLSLAPPGGVIGADIRFVGDRGSILEISTGVNGVAFNAGNLNILSFDNLVFTGKNVPEGDPAFYDAKYVVFSNFVNQTNVSRCQFYGIAVPNNAAIIYAGVTDLKIADSQFDGSLAAYIDGAVVWSENSRGITVSRSTFLDYANLNGQYLSKSTALVGSWIKVSGQSPNDANGPRRVVIEDSRFDEGSATAITIVGVEWVSIKGINVNVNGASPGKGIYLNNVEHTVVKQSFFGYTANARPAFHIENIGVLEVNSVKFGGGVYFLNRTGPGDVKVENCPQCGTSPPPTPTPSPGRTNFALASNGGLASASSEYGASFPARSVNNGDRKGLFWGSGGGWNDGTGSVYPDWVEIGFSGSKAIDEIDVFTIQDNVAAPSEPTESMTFTSYGITRFDVQYWDGSSWVNVPGGGVTNNNKVWTKLTFSPIQTTKIRILVQNALASHSRIAEVEAWGDGGP